MATDERVVSDKRKIGAKGGSGDGAAVDEVAGKKGGKKKALIGVVAVLAAAGAGYWFMLGPGAATDAETTAEEATAEETHEPGSVLVIDSVSINLAGGHYLRLGFALQLTADVHEEPDTARALDLAIDLFSQQPLDEVNDITRRAELKAELLTELQEAYEGEVMDVYFTDFVTQ